MIKTRWQVGCCCNDCRYCLTLGPDPIAAHWRMTLDHRDGAGDPLPHAGIFDLPFLAQLELAGCAAARYAGEWEVENDEGDPVGDLAIEVTIAAHHYYSPPTLDPSATPAWQFLLDSGQPMPAKGFLDHETCLSYPAYTGHGDLDPAHLTPPAPGDSPALGTTGPRGRWLDPDRNLFVTLDRLDGDWETPASVPGQGLRYYGPPD
jgi:hypothetical protein